MFWHRYCWPWKMILRDFFLISPDEQFYWLIRVTSWERGQKGEKSRWGAILTVIVFLRIWKRIFFWLLAISKCLGCWTWNDGYLGFKHTHTTFNWINIYYGIQLKGIFMANSAMHLKPYSCFTPIVFSDSLCHRKEWRDCRTKPVVASKLSKGWHTVWGFYQLPR